MLLRGFAYIVHYPAVQICKNANDLQLTCLMTKQGHPLAAWSECLCCRLLSQAANVKYVCFLAGSLAEVLPSLTSWEQRVFLQASEHWVILVPGLTGSHENKTSCTFSMFKTLDLRLIQDVVLGTGLSCKG